MQRFISSANGTGTRVLHGNCKRLDARQILKQRNYQLVAIREVFYPKGHAVGPHSHERPHLGLVLRGECCHLVGRAREDKCAPGELHYLPAGEKHSFEFYRGIRCMLLQIENPVLERWKDYVNLESRPGKQAGMVFHSIAQRLAWECQQDDDLSPLAVECLVLEALVEMKRSKRLPDSAPPVAVLRARELIHDRSSGPLRLTDIASQVEMHPAHLAREFRRFVNCSMSEYLRQIRVQKAQALLQGSSAPLSEISQMCGFYDQSHFAKCFRQIVGASPLAYKRLVQT